MSNINENEFLTRLMNGESAEDLMASLNAAVETKRKQDQARIQEQKAKAEREAKLDRYATDLLTGLKNYVKVAQPKLAETLTEQDFNVRDLREVLDEGLKSLVAVAELTNQLHSNSKEQSADEKINDFLRLFVD